MVMSFACLGRFGRFGADFVLVASLVSVVPFRCFGFYF